MSFGILALRANALNAAALNQLTPLAGAYGIGASRSPFVATGTGLGEKHCGTIRISSQGTLEERLPSALWQCRGLSHAHSWQRRAPRSLAILDQTFAGLAACCWAASSTAITTTSTGASSRKCRMLDSRPEGTWPHCLHLYAALRAPNKMSEAVSGKGEPGIQAIYRLPAQQ